MNIKATSSSRKTCCSKMVGKMSLVAVNETEQQLLAAIYNVLIDGGNITAKQKKSSGNKSMTVGFLGMGGETI